MKKTFLAVAMAALSIGAQAENWVRVAEIDLFDAYVDKSSVRETGNHVRATVRYKWKKAMETNYGMPYNLEDRETVADCSAHALLSESVTRRLSDGKKHMIVETAMVNPSWETQTSYPSAGSMTGYYMCTGKVFKR